jgi:hypothetical protein
VPGTNGVPKKGGVPKKRKKGKKKDGATHEPAPAPAQAEKPSYKGVSKRLRGALAERELSIPEMMAALEVGEDAVLYALRRLGKSKKGTLRSGMVEARPCWWWEPDPRQAEGGKAGKK